VDDVEATLKADEIMPWEIILFCDLQQCFSALPCAAHELFLGGRRMAYAAVHFEAYELGFGAGRNRGRKLPGLASRR
jgi:hypothetical protein